MKLLIFLSAMILLGLFIAGGIKAFGVGLAMIGVFGIIIFPALREII